jgi:hypothetical protein
MGGLADSWYFAEMSRERKSPQEKKELEYTRDHFTGGWDSSRYFPKTWRRKKVRVNRQYRRKSEEVLTPLKVGSTVEDLESIADDLTAARFQESISRKRLRKVGTVTLGEKVKHKLERRAEAVGRKVSRDRHEDEMAAAAIKTMTALTDDELEDFVRRVDLLCCARSGKEHKRVFTRSDNPIDRALRFLNAVCVMGSASEINALRRSPSLDAAFRNWLEKANRIILRQRHAKERKVEGKERALQRLKAYGRK